MTGFFGVLCFGLGFGLARYYYRDNATWWEGLARSLHQDARIAGAELRAAYELGRREASSKQQEWQQ